MIFLRNKNAILFPTPNSRAIVSVLLSWGPDDHRHSGERAAYGSQMQRCIWRAEFP
jgi:hypothetical protein